MENSEELRNMLVSLWRIVDRLRTESQHLRRSIEEAQQREQDLQQTSNLLTTVVDQLPVAVTVQGEDGRFVLANAAAGAQFGASGKELTGVSPAALLPEEQAARRREQEISVLCSGKPLSVEEAISGPDGDRTLLISHRPMRVRDKTLLLSTSLDITDRKEVESELTRRAYFDELTGLPNRSLIQERVEAMLERRAPAERLAIAFIDVDNFKHINDYYNHAVGDALLVKMAERIAVHVRASDMLARISGDEFVLILDPLESNDQLETIINNLLHQLKQPFYIEGFEIFTSASIGVSVYPEHGRHYEALRRNADSAMYRVKSGAKGGAAFFDASTGQDMAARMELEQRLRLAIRDYRVCCAFQPKVDIRTQEVIGLEALVRLRDENGVIQAPSEFVGLAVELGLIDHITHLVLAESMKAIDQFDDAFGHGTTISINVAAKQATDLEFMHAFADALKETGCPERFMLELTEDAFLSKSRFQAEVLPMLREIGVRVSIDDFGTGYSSLSALADITADEIKVDRSFITAIHQRPRSQSVLKAIESLSDALGMTVIAEGVETFEELAYLQAATRIQYAQGYYFARPFFLEDFAPSNRLAYDTRAAPVNRERAEGRGLRSRAVGDWRRE